MNLFQINWCRSCWGGSKKELIKVHLCKSPNLVTVEQKIYEKKLIFIEINQDVTLCRKGLTVIANFKSQHSLNLSFVRRLSWIGTTG